ncbi:MAG: hypothetical protein LBR12_04595 [Opitutaceae bacterium]|jgi:uncharacterized membrane protein YhaH (DUF805 family)|nr:hypothetical protein [Opitutaceae bacterium]
MATHSQTYTKHDVEIKRKRRLLNRAYVYWPCALFFVWAPLLFTGFALLMRNLGHLDTARKTDPVFLTFFIGCAVTGPVCAMLVMRTQRIAKLLWAILNSIVCPSLVLFWLFLIARTR